MTTRYIAITTGAFILAYAAYAVGQGSGRLSARAEFAALPSPTPHIITRIVTRTVTVKVPEIKTRTVTKIVVRTIKVPVTKIVTKTVPATPMPSPTVTPADTPAESDGAPAPETMVNGATYCTYAQLCVTLVGTTFSQGTALDGGDKLVLWLNVVNNGSDQGNVGYDNFSAALPGGKIVVADIMTTAPVASDTLAPAGKLYGSMTFDLPSGSQSATIYLTHGYEDQSIANAFGSWDISF